MVAGGHHRFEVSSDGQKILTHQPLSKECNTVGRDQVHTEEPAALLLTHQISYAPVATHVFLNLWHELQIGVTTADGLWPIDEGIVYYRGRAR